MSSVMFEHMNRTNIKLRDINNDGNNQSCLQK